MFIREIKVSPDFNQTPQASYVGQSGMLSWDNGAKRLKLFNGEVAHEVYVESPSIELTVENSMALAWAKQKMREEAELLALCAKHPGLKDAKDAFDIMRLLCKSNQ